MKVKLSNRYIFIMLLVLTYVFVFSFLIFNINKIDKITEKLEEFKSYNDLLMNLEKYNQERTSLVFRSFFHNIPNYNYNYFFEIDSQVSFMNENYIGNFSEKESEKFQEFLSYWSHEKEVIVENAKVNEIKDIKIFVIEGFLDFFLLRSETDEIKNSSSDSLGFKVLNKSLDILVVLQRLREIILDYLQTDYEVIPKEEIQLIKSDLLRKHEEFKSILEQYSIKYEHLLDFLFMRMSKNFDSSYDYYINKFLDDTTDQILLKSDFELASKQVLLTMDLLSYMLNVESKHYEDRIYKYYSFLKILNVLYFLAFFIYLTFSFVNFFYGERIKLKFINLKYGVKVTLLFVVMILLSNFLLFSSVYYIDREILLKEIHRRNRVNIKFAIEKFYSKLDSLQKNIMFLNKLSLINFNVVNYDFQMLSSFLMENGDYTEISIIDYDDYGEEKFRMIKDANANIIIADDRELLNLSRDSSFQEGLQLLDEQVYLSNILLSNSSDKFSPYIKREIIAVTPMYDVSGNLRSLLRVKMDLSELFEDMKSYFSSQGELFILDKDMNLLLNGKNKYKNVLQINKDSIFTMYEDLTLESSSFYKINELYKENSLGNKQYLQYIKVPFNLNLDGSNYIWVLYALQDELELSKSKKITFYVFFILLGLLPFAFITTTLFSRLISVPLKKIAVALKRFGERDEPDGELSFDLPVESKDEIGFLAGSFRDMMIQVEQKKSMHVFLKDIAMIANEARSLEDSVEKMFSCIRKNYDWELFHLFVKEKGKFVDSNIWYYHKHNDCVEFEGRCDKVIKMSTELFSDLNNILEVLYPVILNSEVYYLSNLKVSRNKHRTRILTANGFSSLMFIPVFMGKEVVGIIDMYSQKNVEVTEEFLDAMHSLSIQLSRIMYRQGTEKILYNYQMDLEKMVLDKTKELKYAKENAENANNLKDELLANISHEFRTPLHSIIGFSNILLKKGDNLKQEDKIKNLNFIRDSGKQLLDLVDSLLDLSKLESKKITLKISKYNVNEIINFITEELTPQLYAKSLKVALQSESEHSMIEVDKVLIMQLCRNILSNAIKFSYTGSEIFIRVIEDSDHDRLVVEYENKGPIVPKSEISNIFDKFVQSSLTKTFSGGTGLGLAICREIVSYHNGEIFMSNLPDDSGVVVKFVLPYKYEGKKADV